MDNSNHENEENNISPQEHTSNNTPHEPLTSINSRITDFAYLLKLSITSYILALASIIFGIVEMYYYPSYDPSLDMGSSFNHVVGGDAYNFIIIGVRGLGWITIGVSFCILGSALLVGYFIKGSTKHE